jgi:hypothetical protein
MSSVMDSGASNARIDRVCPKCKGTKFAPSAKAPRNYMRVTGLRRQSNAQSVKHF